MMKQSEEIICCLNLKEAKSCHNPKCKLRQQLFEKIKKLLMERKS